MRNIHNVCFSFLPLLVCIACGGASGFSAEAEPTAATGAGGEPPQDELVARPQHTDVPGLEREAGGGSGGTIAGGGTASDDVHSLAGSGGQADDGEERPLPSGPREVLQTIHPVAALSGVVAGGGEPARVYAFLSFDLRELPDNIVTLEHATARAGDYVVAAPVPVFDVSFDDLEQASSAAPNRFITTLPSGLQGDQPIPPALWSVLGADYASRDTVPYAQFRFDLPAGTDTAIVQTLLQSTSLELDYFVL